MRVSFVVKSLMEDGRELIIANLEEALSLFFPPFFDGADYVYSTRV